MKALLNKIQLPIKPIFYQMVLNLSNQLAHKTLSGTASLLREKSLHPAELKDMVASPAGTTISALRHLELVGLRSALIEAVVLAAQKSRQLADEV